MELRETSIDNHTYEKIDPEVCTRQHTLSNNGDVSNFIQPYVT